MCNEELRCQPVLSRLPCSHVFCPPCLGEWASYLASKHQTPTCPLCRGSAQITELVPRRVLLDNYGNVRPSKSRPGYLHERPGRKALPFHKDGGWSHHKNSRTDDKVVTEKTTRKLTATAEARRYADAARKHEEVMLKVNQQHECEMIELVQQHEEVVSKMKKKIQSLKMQLGKQQKRTKTFKARAESSRRDKDNALITVSRVREQMNDQKKQQKHKLDQATSSVVRANKRARLDRRKLVLSEKLI